MITQTKLTDVIATISVYMESAPQLFTTEDESMILSAVWNSELNEDGHTVLGLVLDAQHALLTAVESEEHHYPEYGKYTLAGIAYVNDLTFEAIISDGCVSCSVGEEIQQTAQTAESDESNNKPIVH